jgi:Na+/H+ antiporter NhaD/arsenite permease-like protein
VGSRWMHCWIGCWTDDDHRAAGGNTVAVFVTAYVLIATEKVHRIAAALGGAVLMLVIGATDAEHAFFSEESGIDWHVIFLLLGMMLIVAVLRRTGVFEFVAIWAVKRARGRPFRVMVILVLVTAIASAPWTTSPPCCSSPQ